MFKRLLITALFIPAITACIIGIILSMMLCPLTYILLNISLDELLEEVVSHTLEPVMEL